jgi:hypothetical protein
MTAHGQAAGPLIEKADGTVEPFDPGKLEHSLERSGASPALAARVAAEVTAGVAPGSRSKDIYRRAFTMLRAAHRPAAMRYGLRRALLEMGPSGHPFEDFIAELFRAEGWNVEWRKIIEGKCVPHEVDLYATRGAETVGGELKYHNDAAYKTDVKTALYVKARFDDIWNCDPARQTCPLSTGMLVTNTKFTSQAIAYAECSGLALLGWSYPAQGNLFDRIVAANVYPVSAFTTLKAAEKRLLLEQGIVTSRLLIAHREALRAIHLPPERVGEVLAEARMVHEDRS